MSSTRLRLALAIPALFQTTWLTSRAAFAEPPARQNDDASQGCAQANDRAIEDKHQSRLRAARQEYFTCASASCPAEIRGVCADRLDKIKDEIPTVVFELTEAKDRQGPIRVTMDGEVLTEQLQGLALEVDPGLHWFVFEARGMTAVRKQLNVLQGVQHQRFQIDDRQPSVAAVTDIPPSITTEPPIAATPTAGASAPTLAVSSGTEPGPSSLRRKLGIAGIAAGGAFVIAGAVSWKLSNDRYNDLKAACDSGCTVNERSDGMSAVQTRDRLAVGGFVVGGALLAGGVTALLVPAGNDGATARVGFAANLIDRAIFLRGSF
jgi:hypothetical protein